jgi:hypothetical protein
MPFKDKVVVDTPKPNHGGGGGELAAAHALPHQSGLVAAVCAEC